MGVTTEQVYKYFGAHTPFVSTFSRKQVRSNHLNRSLASDHHLQFAGVIVMPEFNFSIKES